MENKTNIKKGDKLYTRYYINNPMFSGRSKYNGTYTVKFVKRGRIHLMGGYLWTIGINKIGDEYFTSKEELFKHKLKLAESTLKEDEETFKDVIAEKTEEYKESRDRVQAEIRYLKKQLASLLPTLKSGVSEKVS